MPSKKPVPPKRVKSIRIRGREPRDGFDLVNPDELRKLSIRNKLEQSIRQIVGDNEAPAFYELHTLTDYEPHWFSASHHGPYGSKLDPILQPERHQSPLAGGRFLYKEEVRCPGPVPWWGPHAFSEKREADVRAKRGETLKPAYNYAQVLEELDLDPELFVEVPVYVWNEYDDPSTPLPTFSVISPQSFDAPDVDDDKTVPIFKVAEEWQPPGSTPAPPDFEVVASKPAEASAEQSAAEVPSAIAVPTCPEVTPNRPAAGQRGRSTSLPPSLRNGPKTNNGQSIGSHIPVAMPRGRESRSMSRNPCPAEKTVSDGSIMTRKADNEKSLETKGSTRNEPSVMAKSQNTRHRSPSKIPVARKKMAQQLPISTVKDMKTRRSGIPVLKKKNRSASISRTNPATNAMISKVKACSASRSTSLPPSDRLRDRSEFMAAKDKFPGPIIQTNDEKKDRSAKKVITRHRSPSKIPVARKKVAQQVSVSTVKDKEIEQEKTKTKGTERRSRSRYIKRDPREARAQAEIRRARKDCFEQLPTNKGPSSKLPREIMPAKDKSPIIVAKTNACGRNSRSRSVRQGSVEGQVPAQRSREIKNVRQQHHAPSTSLPMLAKNQSPNVVAKTKGFDRKSRSQSVHPLRNKPPLMAEELNPNPRPVYKPKDVRTKSLTRYREQSPSKIPVMVKRSSAQQPIPQSMTWVIEMDDAASGTDDGIPQRLLKEESHHPSAVQSLPIIVKDRMVKKSPKAAIPSSNKRASSIPVLPGVSTRKQNDNNNADMQKPNIRAKKLREPTPLRKKEWNLPPPEEVPNHMKPDCRESSNTKIPRTPKQVTAPGLYPKRAHSLPPLEISKRNACVAEDGLKNEVLPRTKPKIPAIKTWERKRQSIPHGISWEMNMDRAIRENGGSGIPLPKEEEAACSSPPTNRSCTKERSPSKIPVWRKKKSPKKSRTKKRSRSKIPVRVKNTAAQNPIPKSVAWEIEMYRIPTRYVSKTKRTGPGKLTNEGEKPADSTATKDVPAPKSSQKKNEVKCCKKFTLKTYTEPFTKSCTCRYCAPVKHRKKVPINPQAKPRCLYEPFQPKFIQWFNGEHKDKIDLRKEVYPGLEFKRDDWVPLVFIEPGDEVEERLPLTNIKEWEEMKVPFNWTIPQNLDASAQKEVATASILPSTEISFVDACAAPRARLFIPASNDLCTCTARIVKKSGASTKVPHPQACPAKRVRLSTESSRLPVVEESLEKSTHGAQRKTPLAGTDKLRNLAKFRSLSKSRNFGFEVLPNRHNQKKAKSSPLTAGNITPPVSTESDSSAATSRIHTPEADAASDYSAISSRIPTPDLAAFRDASAISSRIPTPEAIAASLRALSPKQSKVPIALPISTRTSCNAEDRRHIMTPFSLLRIETPKRKLQKRVMSPGMG